MGDKIVCLDCKKTYNRELDNRLNVESICSNCGKKMIRLPHRFRPPKITDKAKWDTVKFLIGKGFFYQHIYETVETNNHLNRIEPYGKYPDNLREAKEFVEKYKTQARKRIMRNCF